MRARLALATVLIALSLAPSGAGATQSPAKQLAEQHMPVLTLEPQQQPCDSGEAYRPTTVDVVLGKQGVVLRDPDDQVVKQAPTGLDLFGLGEGYYLDQPGDPLNPGCVYEKNFQKWNAGRKPTVYAHVAGDPAHRDKLAVQYWFFYSFNDFTDKHEGDWEMAQVDFDAPTPEEALKKEPYEVGLAQHAGGERADWSDVHKQGPHPVLFRRDRFARDLFRHGPLPRAGRIRGLRVRRHERRHPPDPPADGAAAGGPGQGLGAVLLAGVPRPLGAEGEGHQQRADGAGGEVVLVAAHRVGGRPARHQRDGAQHEDPRPERDGLLLRGRDTGIDRAQLGDRQPVAVPRSRGTAGGRVGRRRAPDHLAPGGPGAAPEGARRRADPPGGAARLRQRRAHVLGHGGDLHPRQHRRGGDSVGPVSPHRDLVVGGTRRTPWGGDGDPRAADRRGWRGDFLRLHHGGGGRGARRARAGTAHQRDGGVSGGRSNAGVRWPAGWHGSSAPR